MKLLRTAVLTLMISGLSMTISFAELQAFVNTEKAYVREKVDYSSNVLLELKNGDRVEILEASSPLLVDINSKKGYMDDNQISVYNIKKSGEVKLSKNVSVGRGLMTIEKGTSLPVYDYTNKHYMIKWNGFYYFVHESAVEKKLTGLIERPILVTDDIFGENKLEEVGLAELFGELDLALSEYQKQNSAEKNTITLIQPKEVSLKNETKFSEKTAQTKSESSNNNEGILEKYKNIPIVAKAFEELGKPYIWGTIGPNAYDCSGFTYSIFKSVGIKIPRVSTDQGQSGTPVEKTNLKTGDLIFFDTRSVNDPNDITDNPGQSLANESIASEKKTTVDKINKKFIPTTITHVGMYIGDGYFIHASSGERKVVVQTLNLPYYTERFLWAKRYM